MFTNKYNRFYFILFSTVVILADQYTKHIINLNHQILFKKNLILFSLDNVRNYGAAFNLFSGSRIFLSLISIFIAIILILVILYKKNIKNIDLLSYSFILGGTIGNGLDRIIRGYVIDFININFINFPVFNIADISINVGFIIIIYDFIKNKRL